MKTPKLAAVFILPLLLSGCADQRPLSAIVYDSLQNREKIVHPGDDPIPPPTTSYDTYRKEREKVLSGEADKQP